MNGRRQRAGIIGPLLLIAAGIVLLLNQAGQLPWDIWSTLWRFWPVLAILLGIDILIGVSRSTVVYIAGLMIGVALIVSTLVLATRSAEPRGSARFPVSAESLAEPLHEAQRARILLDQSVGSLTVGALEDSTSFVEGTIEYSRSSHSLQKSVRRSGAGLEFSLSAKPQFPSLWLPGDNIGDRWDLQFSTQIPLEVTVNLGAGSALLDLSKLQVTRLDVHGGVGRIQIAFPSEAALTKASVSAAVGEIIILIPEQVGVRIRTDTALASIRVDNRRLVRTDDGYLSSDYDTMQNKLELEIESAIGAVVVR